MRRIAALSILFTLAAGGALVLAPGHESEVVRGWLIGLAAIGALTAARRISSVPSERVPVRRPWRRHRPPSTEGPEDLQAIRLALDLAQSSEFDLHHRLRPLFAETAEALLAARHLVDLRRSPERVRQLVDPDLWELIGPDRPEPPDRGRRRLEPERLERMIGSLEALAR